MGSIFHLPQVEMRVLKKYLTNTTQKMNLIPTLFRKQQLEEQLSEGAVNIELGGHPWMLFSTTSRPNTTPGMLKPCESWDFLDLPSSTGTGGTPEFMRRHPRLIHGNMEQKNRPNHEGSNWIPMNHRGPERQSPVRQLWKESHYGLLVKVAWGVFQRCVETTSDGWNFIIPTV